MPFSYGDASSLRLAQNQLNTPTSRSTPKSMGFRCGETLRVDSSRMERETWQIIVSLTGHFNEFGGVEATVDEGGGHSLAVEGPDADEEESGDEARND